MHSPSLALPTLHDHVVPRLISSRPSSSVSPLLRAGAAAGRAHAHGLLRAPPSAAAASPTPNPAAETKLQRMSLMQEGRAMGEGQEYSASSYKRMADEFRTNWMNSHYQESMEKGSRRALEIDYWRLIKGASGEDVQVEYGNDLSTEEYGSGFPLRRPIGLLSPRHCGPDMG